MGVNLVEGGGISLTGQAVAGALTGADQGDDEQLTVDLTALSPRAERVACRVSSYGADPPNQNIGQLRSAFIRVVDRVDGVEPAWHGTDWTLRAVGAGYAAGPRGSAQDYGLPG